MVKAFKEEFELKNWKINDAEPRTFVIGQLVPMFFYPLWTLIWAIYHALNFILMPYYRTELAPYPEPWPFYLSNWTYTVLTIGAVWDCVATIYVYLKKQSLLVPVPGALASTPWFQQVVWVTYNITNVTNLTMTILLGSLVTYRSDAASILIQIFSSIYVIANIFIGAKETRILHVYQPIAFMFVYIVFNMIYSMASGKAVYSTMNWRGQPGFSILWLFGLLLLIAPLVHLFVYGLYRLREFINDKCCKKDVTDVV
ncbi:uncharacterized protein LOC130048350 [Ostrea edulis]|uniref:uncharacterized protein LOC130048350 n=1 Tax=Ostrea edulis TaxID=37623 RepID=UPI0024AF5A33|nr:uncharacterized protein LOC130048350 [Ostrea edulis]